MISLWTLWLPIVLSALAVFILSNLFWMALPFWHQKDYGKLSNEKSILDALANVTSGQYIAPAMDWKTTTPEQRQEAQKGPTAYMLVRNPSAFNFPMALALYFLNALVIAIFVAYLTSRTRGAGTESLEVFRVAATVSFLAYAFRGVPDSIWYGKPWMVTFKEMIDGLLYGVTMGAVFAWLWPR